MQSESFLPRMRRAAGLRVAAVTSLILAVIASLLVAVTPTSAAAVPLAEASDTASASSNSVPKSTIAPRKGPSLRPGKKVSPKEVRRRNSPGYAGAAPKVVQRPILVREKGRYGVYASATVAPIRGKSGKKKRIESLYVGVTVVRKDRAISGVGSPAHADFHKKVVIKAGTRGLSELWIPMTKRDFRKVKALQRQRAHIYLTLNNLKDTFPEFGKQADLQQIVTAKLTTKRLTNKQVKRRNASNLRAQRKEERGPARRTSTKSLATRNWDIGARDKLWVYNNTPFTQHVQIQPNLACMDFSVSSAQLFSTPGVTSAAQDVPPVTGAVAIQGKGWGPTTAGNPPSDGGQSMATSMADTGREVLNQVSDLIASPETYSEKGLIAGAVGLGLHTLAGVIAAAIKANNQCNDYGQYWAVTSTPTMVGSKDQPGVIVGNPSAWATGSFNTLGYGVTSVEVGNPASHAKTLPAVGSSDFASLSNILNNAVGQQATTTFFDNGGMAAPVAKAGGKANWNGQANYAQGLIHYIYPNVPSCQWNDCNEQEFGVQLGYLVDNYDTVVGPQLLTSPTATATPVVDPNTGNSGVQLTCTITPNGNFNNPFGGTQGKPSTVPVKELTSLKGTSGVTDANFVVSYYAQDANGTYLYNSGTTSSFPGPVGEGTGNPPSLKATADGIQSVDMNQPSATALNLSAADLSNLVNPVTGKPAVATKFGCSAIPFVSFQDMDVTSGSPWGGNWPFPQVQSGGWLSSPYANTFNWPNPVNALNVTWSGDTYLSSPVASPMFTPPNPVSVSPASGPVTGDTNVTISGSGFDAGALVTVGGQPCTDVVLVDSETITCTTSAVSAADVRGHVVVTSTESNASGTGKDLFTFNASVTGVSPALADSAGGTKITIAGVGFGRDSTVTVGDKPCKTPLVVSTTEITCYTPSHAPGTVDVVVTNPRPLSSATLAGALTIDHVEISTYTSDGTFVVPQGVTEIKVQLSGGGGGNSSAGGAGGVGAAVTGTIAVTPGSSLTVQVGGLGGNASSGTGGAGGTHGGGAGGSGTGSYGGGAGGGGGCSVILDGQTPLIVAGAGGGAASVSTAGAAGANGGLASASANSGQGGFAGTLVSGGAGGAHATNNGQSGSAGSSMAGGNGGSYSYQYTHGGGGGGCGYFGGGGGGTDYFNNPGRAGSGGGGSSYTGGAGVSGAVVTTASVRAAGSVTISYKP